MEIKETQEKDFPAVLALYEKARVFMHTHGNPTQWTMTPDETTLRKDYERKGSFVVVDGGEIIGTFALLFNEDLNYRDIQGRWVDASPYVTVHHLASGRSGVGTFILEELKKKYPHLRIDTHHNNAPMKALLAKEGFLYCGVIRLLDGDGTSREAYEWSRQK
jgi:RimJ/RimL family protein N-acetyltransferase